MPSACTAVGRRAVQLCALSGLGLGMRPGRQGGHVSDGDGRFSDVADSDGRSLRDLRAERLLSMRELAQRAGVSPSTIYMIEAGRSTARPSVARCIANALGVDPHGISEVRRTIRQYGGLR